jgi:hypothetical protein
VIPALERLKKLLREEWDPIEMMPHLPADEYDSCAMAVFSRLKAGASVEDIYDYLATVARDQIHVEAVPDRDRAVAEKARAIMDE